MCRVAPPFKAGKMATRKEANTASALTTVVEWGVGIALCGAHVMFMSKAWEGVDRANAFAKTSLYTPLVATLIYFSFIYWGRKIMHTREPFGLKTYMIVYNLYQTILNAWWCYAVVRQVNHDYGGRWFESIAAAPDRRAAGFNLGFIIWIHYNNKMVEMLDTVFMVLRKKEKQVSFLHVYHHVLILWAWFTVCHFGAGGASYFGGLMNSGIHVCMYSYYLLRLLNIPCPWKSHLTKAQLLQFCICMVHSWYNLYVGLYPRWLSCFQMFVMANMLVLFMDFYRNAYGQGGKKNSVKETETAKAK